MKTVKKVLLTLMIALSLNAWTQTIGDYIDVVHLKNGSIIKGIIIEQIPSKSIKIKTNDGSEYVFTQNEIEKFSREDVKGNYIVIEENFQTTTEEESQEDKISWIDNFKKKDKGYFIELDMLLNSSAQGWRVTNGYKFGRFGFLGLAVGVENQNFDFNQNRHNGSFRYNYDLYSVANVNIVYSGEFFNKRITPFYQAEIGYGVPLNRSYSINAGQGDLEYRNYGGPMGAVTFGLKFKTKRKVVYKLSLDSRWISNYSENEFYINSSSSTKGIKKNYDFNPGLGLRFGIGF